MPRSLPIMVTTGSKALRKAWTYNTRLSVTPFARAVMIKFSPSALSISARVSRMI
ncbi:MAG: hypothetical protein ABIP78_09700 [Pyrinomonadaceae bacterium]